MDWRRFDESALADVDADVVRGLEAALDPNGPPDYRALAARLARDWAGSRPRRVGIAGGQGAGKSTLSRLLVEACERAGLRAAVIGLDDFYRTKAERCALAAEVHPLLATRGVPGTHDTAWCARVMDALIEGGAVTLPTFDKGVDDRAAERSLEGPFDLVLFEGWCIGVPPAAEGELAVATNALEAEEDADGEWRRAVDRALRDEYQALWSRLDALVFLRVPGLDAVRRWRLQQEGERPAAQRLDAAAVDRFVAHYERITLRMLETLPGRADWTVSLAEDHSVAALERGSGFAKDRG